jgi:hypothetical protein
LNKPIAALVPGRSVNIVFVSNARFPEGVAGFREFISVVAHRFIAGQRFLTRFASLTPEAAGLLLSKESGCPAVLLINVALRRFGG